MDGNSKLKQVTLHITKKVNTDLESAMKDFSAESFAILYSPSNCHLALWKNGNFVCGNGKEIRSVFEARVFNQTAELRWLKDGKSGRAVILSEDERIGFKDESIGFEKVPPTTYETICQKYLIWGQSTGKSSDDENWTQFGSAQIGSFYVPVPNVAEQGYAQFTAVEYLKEFEDGNVAVFEERLTGISEVK